MSTGKTLILGIGNQLMSDDGVGGKAIQLLTEQTQQFPNVSCLDGGTLGHLLVGYIEEADDLIVVDAAQMHMEPGVVRVFENEEMDWFLSTNTYRSVHSAYLWCLYGGAWTHLGQGRGGCFGCQGSRERRVDP